MATNGPRPGRRRFAKAQPPYPLAPLTTAFVQGWPPVAVPETEAYKSSRDRIEAQIRRIPTYKLHWDEFYGFVQSRLMPSFTPMGFKKMRAPEHLYHKLRDAYDEGLENLDERERPESFSHKPGATTPKSLLPNFIGTHDVNNAVMDELRPLHEEWAGVKLRNGQSYGIRVYKNGSTLVNHVDRSETHVISCIFHGEKCFWHWLLDVRAGEKRGWVAFAGHGP